MRTVGYAYDSDGRRTIMSLVGTGSWTYGYDAGGRLTKLTSPTDGTTTFAYDGAGGRGAKDGNGLTQYGLLSSKTEGNGNYELYDYDQCSQQISTGYWWADGTQQNALVYSYDPAGNVKSVNQGWYSTTYGYDGADQLTSETNANGSSSAPPTVSYTYDHNGNRLTQTQNGQPLQSFTYDAHDKLTSGTSGSETDGYDAMGNETSTTIGGGTYRETYDDEDRLTSLTLPSGVVDSFTYNGLGLRVTKTDSTGSYAFVCDGTSAGSPVLTDGAALYTPGLSENRGGASRYYSNDQRGNLWTIDASSKGQLDYQDTTGFGTLLGSSGSGSVFGYGGGNGCQTDADTGLILMGHRYYDTRIGRFITQDPAGDGDNWYAYAGNSPTNNTDPTGLVIAGSGMGIPGWDDSQKDTTYNPDEDANEQYYEGVSGEYNDYNAKTGAYIGSEWLGATAFDQMNMSSMGPGVGMFAQPGRAPGKPPLSAYKTALGKVHQIVGKQPGTARGKAKNGSPMRGNTN